MLGDHLESVNLLRYQIELCLEDLFRRHAGQVAVYLADKLSQGETLDSVLETAIEDLDGTFSFLVSTKNEIGYAKDNLAAKPMVLYETDDMIAIASEEVSLNRLFPGQSINSTEPAPGTHMTWSRSI